MNNAKYKFLFMIGLFTVISMQAQTPLSSKEVFTRADTLRGSITPERAWWDVLHYTIGVTPDFLSKYIEGKTEIRFKVLAPGKTMQIDLQEPMQLSKAYTTAYKDLPLRRDGNVYYVSFPKELKTGSVQTLTLVFHGNPRIAKRPPWDGGWIFQTDKLGRPWMSVACQGLGASVWYPCKDHQSDEPDQGATLNITVPDTLVAVGNGRLISKISHSKGLVTYKWDVKNPINNYDIIPYIGKYVTWHETFNGEKGPLDCDYWVLDYELEKAKEQFKQAPKMLRCFEHWMGPYPFYEDSYKLVQSPHLGMEHQSAVAYGNQFKNGYLGRDLSGTGWGLKWDFIIVHESGHEWFGNNITSKDIADMWIHEGFTNYSETLFTECEYGLQAANEYNYGIRRVIRNDVPITGPYGVNKEGSGDMYPKAANMIHSIRNAMHDDEKFRNMLRFLGKKFYHQTVTADDIREAMESFTGFGLDKIFNQYLHTTQVPVLEYKLDGAQVSFRWSNCVDGFNLPLWAGAGNQAQLVKPVTGSWTSLQLSNENAANWKPENIEKLFYVKVQKATNN
ncbi:Peptidase family M1 [Hydrobacter penzbergensis]|uniref:Peptidase family M1 n=1 Tax=Hydrobacter penzbergensis TaxID=1235997 RepID=A0A8X8IIG5_9BACT|nr:M1 family metallopeptidase [Hydrobacter penzbergensis]SDX50792.1 Peptidase family M1 [Hydrobacter penzbergensis]